MPYNPSRISEVASLEELRQYVQEEFEKISKEMNETIALDLRSVHSEPSRPREGMLVSADGTDWNPGAGAGAYEYVSGAWRRVAGITNGDYGDITISGGVWSIDTDVVANSKLANMAVNTIKGRKTAGTGDPEDLSAIDAWSVLMTAATLAVPFQIMEFSKYTGDSDTGGRFTIKKNTNSTLSGDVLIQNYLNQVSIFENGGAFRGFNLDISKGAALAASELATLSLVASAEATMSGASVSIINIPAHKILILQIVDASHDSGSAQSLRVALSVNNGSSYGTAISISGSVSSAVAAHTTVTIGSNSPTNTLHVVSCGINSGGVDSTDGAVNAIQITWSGGNFDAGSYLLWAFG